MLLLSNLLGKFVKKGTLRLYDAGGELHVFGGKHPGPRHHPHSRPRLEKRLFPNPELHAGEAYMDGTLTFEEGRLHDFMLLFSVNRAALCARLAEVLRRMWRALRRWHQANTVGQAAEHARHHYDMSTELYRLFLDEDLQYSCAYFRDPDDTLEQAQGTSSSRHRQAAPEAGMMVAEIGCGWGAFAIHLARETGARVTAINVSPEQLQVARERAPRQAWPTWSSFASSTIARWRAVRPRRLRRHDGACRDRPLRRVFRQDPRPADR